MPQPYLLTVGTLQPRKNLEAALRAFEHLADAGAEHHLVVAGARGWGEDALIARFEGARWHSRVHVVGRVADDALVTLYRGADCFVFPSRGEGFGLPPLEAMACGTPVVASRASSIPEVVGDAGVLVDPDEVAEIAGALERVVGSPSTRAECPPRTRASAGLHVGALRRIDGARLSSRARRGRHGVRQTAAARVRPSVSVSISAVIPTSQAWPEIQPCLDALFPEARKLGAEVIVLDPHGRGLPRTPSADIPASCT